MFGQMEKTFQTAPSPKLKQFKVQLHTTLPQLTAVVTPFLLHGVVEYSILIGQLQHSKVCYF